MRYWSQPRTQGWEGDGVLAVPPMGKRNTGVWLGMGAVFGDHAERGKHAIMRETRQSLFTARQDGYLHYRIPGLVRTARGVLLACAEARCAQRMGQAKSHGDYRDQDIVIRRSLDNGRTWLPQQVVLSHQPFGPGPLHNFMVVADRAGRLHALVLHDYKTLLYLVSDDDGASWSAPQDRTALIDGFKASYDWKAIGTGCGHGIQLRSGRLLIPVWLSDNSHSAHLPSIVTTVYSDDAGVTWQRGAIVCPTTPEFRWPSEGMAVELPDGRVMLNMRNESDERRRLVTVSPDGISRWSEAVFDPALAEPVCEGALIGFADPRDASRQVLAFVNPDSLERTQPGGGGYKSDRKNLTLKLSFDQGAAWPVSRVIEAGPSGYSDLCALPDGSLLVLFECGIASGDMHDSAGIVVERVDLMALLSAAGSGA